MKKFVNFSVLNNSSSCMTDYHPVVGLPQVVTNELEQLLRSACGEDAAQALVPILIFMKTNAPVSEIIKSHAQHLPVGWRDRNSFIAKLDFWLPQIADRLYSSFVTRLFPTCLGTMGAALPV